MTAKEYFNESHPDIASYPLTLADIDDAAGPLLSWVHFHDEGKISRFPS
jgi:hypothetical protein